MRRTGAPPRTPGYFRHDETAVNRIFSVSWSKGRTVQAGTPMTVHGESTLSSPVRRPKAGCDPFFQRGPNIPAGGSGGTTGRGAAA